MKIKDYKCKKCNGADFDFLKPNENVSFKQETPNKGTVGIYCTHCGAWFKWASKDEKNLMGLTMGVAGSGMSFANKARMLNEIGKNSALTTFEGLPAGTVLVSSDGEMTVTYSDYWSENGEKEFCLADDKCLWRGCQFDPADWKIKEGE